MAVGSGSEEREMLRVGHTEASGASHTGAEVCREVGGTGRGRARVHFLWFGHLCVILFFLNVMKGVLLQQSSAGHNTQEVFVQL